MAMLIIWPKKWSALCSREESWRANVKSQLPRRYGLVIPSGLLPSSRAKPIGSKTAGTPAETSTMEDVINAGVPCYAASALIAWQAMVSEAVDSFTALTAVRSPTRSAQAQACSEPECSVSIVLMLGDGSAWSQRLLLTHSQQAGTLTSDADEFFWCSMSSYDFL